MADQIASPASTSDERMYALVQMEHFVAERVLTNLPALQQKARDTGVRRHTFHSEIDRCCDWSVPVHGARLFRTCVY